MTEDIRNKPKALDSENDQDISLLEGFTKTFEKREGISPTNGYFFRASDEKTANAEGKLKETGKDLENIVERFDFSKLEKGFRFASSDENYTIIEKLGEGGQGPCYLGEDSSGRKKVLKFTMEKASDPEFEEKRILRYMQVNEALGTNYSLDRINPLFLLVKYDYIEGENTAQKQKKKNKVSSEKEAIDFVKELCTEYLKPLHARGLVHGDIKPENVIEDLNRRRKLIDFELLRKDGDGLSTVNPLVTMAFNDITDKHEKITDYRALARMAYFLMTGKRRSEKDIITIGSPKTDDKMLSDLIVSDEFKKVLNKMLGYNSRYDSVDELVSDLERLDGNKTQLENVDVGDKSKVDIEGFLEEYKKEKNNIHLEFPVSYPECYTQLRTEILPRLGYELIPKNDNLQHFRRIREDGTIDDLFTKDFKDFRYERIGKDGEKELLKVKEVLSLWLLGMSTLPARITKLNGVPALEEALKEVPYKKPTFYMDEKQFVEDVIEGCIGQGNSYGRTVYYNRTGGTFTAEELFYDEFDFDDIKSCKSYKEYKKLKKLKNEIAEIEENASVFEDSNSRRKKRIEDENILLSTSYEKEYQIKYRKEKKEFEKKLHKKQTELQKILGKKAELQKKITYGAVGLVGIISALYLGVQIGKTNIFSILQGEIAEQTYKNKNKSFPTGEYYDIIYEKREIKLDELKIEKTIEPPQFEEKHNSNINYPYDKGNSAKNEMTIYETQNRQLSSFYIVRVSGTAVLENKQKYYLRVYNEGESIQKNERLVPTSKNIYERWTHNLFRMPYLKPAYAIKQKGKTDLQLISL